MRFRGFMKLALLFCFFIFALFRSFELLEMHTDVDLRNIFLRSTPTKANSIPAQRRKCGLSKPCPEGHFTFKITSGAASVIGPKICLEDTMLMSGVENNVGRGMNIALVNGNTGKLIKTDSFDMWAGDVETLLKFLRTIEEGTLVLMATFDDSSTKLNPEAKELIGALGSSSISALGFRDNWVFVGGKGIQSKSPFEQHIKNNPKTNKYEGWPEMLEMEGCFPKRWD